MHANENQKSLKIVVGRVKRRDEKEIVRERTVALSKGDGGGVIVEREREVSSWVSGGSPAHKSLVDSVCLANELHVNLRVLFEAKKNGRKG